MTATQISAYFNAGYEAEKKFFLEKINVCTGVVGESLLYTRARQACNVCTAHKKARSTLIEQAHILRDCVFAVRGIVKLALIELQRKIELAKFQAAVSTVPTEKYCLRNLFTEHDDY